MSIIKEQVLENIKLLSPEGSTITEESTLESLSFDSLDMVEMTMKLEDQFGIIIPDAELEHITTVKDVISLVEQLKVN